MREIALILGLLALAAVVRVGSDRERACRMSWEGINEYVVLADVCKDSDARETLLVGQP